MKAEQAGIGDERGGHSSGVADQSAIRIVDGFDDFADALHVGFIFEVCNDADERGPDRLFRHINSGIAPFPFAVGKGVIDIHVSSQNHTDWIEASVFDPIIPKLEGIRFDPVRQIEFTLFRILWGSASDKTFGNEVVG